ncbi:MAG: hypothetical protein RLZZ514_619 [Actinomycetota bacterium]|jgi:hypothetical protein
MANNDYLEALLEESIKAQDRTTHAVRAIASFFLIQIAYAIAAGFLIAVGMLFSENPAVSVFWTIVASLLLIAGFVHAFTRALIELEASKRPSYVPSLVTQQDSNQSQNSSSTSGEETTTRPATNPQSSAAHEVAAREWSMDWSDDDGENASRFLTSKQRSRWEQAGMPKLSMWVYLGRPNFESWLQSGPFA